MLADPSHGSPPNQILLSLSKPKRVSASVGTSPAGGHVKTGDLDLVAYRGEGENDFVPGPQPRPPV